MPEKISSFVDRFWPWIVSLVTFGVGIGAARAKLVSKKEIYGDGGVPIYMTRKECKKETADCQKNLQEIFRAIEKKIDDNHDKIMSKIDSNQRLMNQTLIDFASKIGR